MPSPLRLAYLVSQYPAINHTYILGEVQGIRGQGIDVEVISIKTPDRPRAELSVVEQEEADRTWSVEQAGLYGLFRAHASTLLRRPLRYFSVLIFALRMSRLCPGEIPRWVLFFLQAVVVDARLRGRELVRLHTHYSSSVGLLVARLFPVRVSHTIHGSGEFQNPAVFRLWEKVHYADFVVTISRFGKSQVMLNSEPDDWPRLEICPLGVDTSRFVPAQRTRPQGDPFELLTVGQLAPAKGIHILIAAMALLTRQGRNVRLRLVGDGPMRQALESEARRGGVAPQVVFAGFRNNTELAQCYAEADVFVLASFAEGVPLVLMEAMAAGVPCVASRITGIPELIEDGVSGLLVTPADEAAIAAAIGRLMDEPELYQRISENARRRVLDQYDREKNTARLAAIFRARAAAG